MGTAAEEMARPPFFAATTTSFQLRIDAVVPRRWLGDAVFFPESRRAYAEMLDRGWVDAVRRIHPEKGIYTYWNFCLSGRLRSKFRFAHGPSPGQPCSNWRSAPPA